MLAELARHPDGIGLDDMSRAVDSPKPTVHRALASLRRAGFARQDGHGRYLLGDELLRLAFAHHEARPEHLRVRGAADRSGRGVRRDCPLRRARRIATFVYRAKVDPAVGAMKLTSTVGGRNTAHSTAVGKLLLSYRLTDQAAVRAWVAEAAPPRRTKNTLVTAAALGGAFAQARIDGFAIDDQENEAAVNCLAVPVWLTPAALPTGAISVSALAHRTPLPVLVEQADRIRSIVDANL